MFEATEVITQEEMQLTVMCMLKEYSVKGLEVFGEVEFKENKFIVSYNMETCNVLEKLTPNGYEFVFVSYTRDELARFLVGLYADLVSNGLCGIDKLDML